MLTYILDAMQNNTPRETIVSASVRWNTRNWMFVRELVCICWPAFLWAVISTSRLRLPPTVKCVHTREAFWQEK